MDPSWVCSDGPKRSWSFFNSPISSLIWSMVKTRSTNVFLVGNNRFSGNNQGNAWKCSLLLELRKKGNGCKLDSAICNTFKGKKWSCPEAFNLKTGVPLGNLGRTCSMSLVFTTLALKRKAVEHPEGVLLLKVVDETLSDGVLAVCLIVVLFTQHVFFLQIPNKLHLHVKYISYVFYIYIYTPICIYIYMY